MTKLLLEEIMNIAAFYKELENNLPQSTSEDRRKWAVQIIEQDFDLQYLSNLLLCDPKVATRFLWLLTGIGQLRAEKLFQELPFLLQLNKQLTHLKTEGSFANYWRIVGVPPENEGEVIDLLFSWLQSTEVNVTAKSRVVFVLFDLTQKYPELKNELRICLEDQLEKNTKDFDRRAQKILKKL